MRPALAIQKLQELKDEASNPSGMYADDFGEGWKSRVRGVVARSLGAGHHLVKKLDDNSYSLGFFSSSTPDSAFRDAFTSGVRRACAYIDAAVYELELMQGEDDPVDERAFDAELWDHVRGLVETDDWDKIPSTVCTFVEDKVRTWADMGTDTYGKGLYGAAMGDAGELRMGKGKGEWEGWRALGIGYAQAIGNVDRHRLQRRSDARRYAIGVLGLGSLLLTQLRYEHQDLIEEREART
ncbi:TIGR02391 family protein [Knoellia sp. 3-2P3]|uniref:TIGR02391 family protein n=1 Tax=unclassified Knoellia TaxID=2618719 RepID=UPI0023DA760A|nr:TIGR02391 family protein [Knoellia sp. 3-2P3]MDF2093614.1 TIGR02391 family protein [Knoellia sp. 3-2P3]